MTAAGSELGVREITARYDGAAVYAPSASAALLLGAGLVLVGRRRPGAHRAV